MTDYLWREASLDHMPRGPLTLGDKKVLLAVIAEALETTTRIPRGVALTKLQMKLRRLWPEAERKG